MKPEDVTEDTAPAGPDGLVLVTWTRQTALGPIAVGFYPSGDPVTRQRQEADLTADLDERTVPIGAVPAPMVP